MNEKEMIEKLNLRKLQLVEDFFVYLYYEGNRVKKVYGHNFQELPIETLLMSELAIKHNKEKRQFTFLEMNYTY